LLPDFLAAAAALEDVTRPKRISFLRQLVLDFGFACEMFFPVEQFARGVCHAQHRDVAPAGIVQKASVARSGDG
jgi:hypothetical protein